MPCFHFSIGVTVVVFFNLLIKKLKFITPLTLIIMTNISMFEVL